MGRAGSTRAWRHRRFAWATSSVVLSLAWPVFAGAHGAVQPSVPSLAQVVAARAPLFSRAEMAGDDAPRYVPTGHVLPRGVDVVVAPDGDDGNARGDARLYATYVDQHGIATSGWVDRGALHAISVRQAAQPWDGHWRSSTDARDLTISQGSASYSYLDGKVPGSRTGLLLRFKTIEPGKAHLVRAESARDPCELSARQLGRYLVLAPRGCQLAQASQGAVLRRVR